MAQFDVIILGGGPAGYVCAIRCAQLGLATAVVEKDKLGGVCVNIGCIPTKALLHSAYTANLIAHDAKDLGIEVGTVTTNYGTAMKRSRKVAEQNSKGVEFLMKKNKVTVLRGSGTLLPGRTVRIVPTTYAMCSQAWELEVEVDGQLHEVMAWGIFTDRIVRHLGADPARHVAVGAGYGLERLAALRYGIDDIRKVESAIVTQ